MAKILKNFKRTGKSIEEFPLIHIMDSEVVALDFPICIVEFDKEYSQPAIRVVQNLPFPVVEEAADIQQHIINGTKVFHFDLEEDGVAVKEVEANVAKIHWRLPVDTDVKELVFMNGTILRQKKVTKIDKTQPEPEEKPQA